MSVHKCTCGNYEYLNVSFCSRCGKRIYGLTQEAQALKDFGFAMRHSSSDISQFYGGFAVAGAKLLPDAIDFTLLLAWAADTRGVDIEPEGAREDLHRKFETYFNTLKENFETAAREGKVDLERAESRITPNLCWLLQSNPRWRMRDAFHAYLDELRRGIVDLVATETLRATEEYFKNAIREWLNSYSIPNFLKPSVSIPTTRLTKSLSEFSGRRDLYLAPSIPLEKLSNALSACGVPEDEEIAALIDCTFWGSAKDALLLGKKALYFHNGVTSGFLPYSELTTRTFTRRPGSESVVSLGDGLFIDLSGSQVDALLCISIIEMVRKQTLIGNEQEKSSGLSGIPGMHLLKQTIKEDVIDVLKNADEYSKYGLALPNGLLFYGPPGCGKTFIAQHLAKELNYNFYEISPGSIASPYIHDTVLKIASIFDNAAKSAPSVIFADEFEGLVPSRRYLTADSQYKAEEVNEWLNQIGNCSARGILFIAATNEPWKIDEAVRRTGRIDRKLYIGPPDEEAIKEMIAFHCKNRPVGSETLASDIASLIAGQGYSASDLKALADEAARAAMKERTLINKGHFEKAASEKVLPSISTESEAEFLAFR